MENINSNWLTANEAASYLKIEPRTLLLWARQGKLKGFTLSGTHRHVWRFRPEDLDGAMMPLPSVAMNRRIQVRQRQGSVVLDRRIRVWNFFFWENGRRRTKKIGTMGQYPTKASAWRAAIPFRHAVENNQPVASANATIPTINTLVEQYREEKMPKRLDTRGGYESWLRVYILPKWGDHTITALQARPVELWLESLALAPKSKVHIRGILSALWNFAMWKQDVPMQVNPISLVTIKGRIEAGTTAA